jgi:hypothetical protein
MGDACPPALLYLLQERLELQRQAEADFAAERAMVDEVVARIQQEDRMELAARRTKQTDTKVPVGWQLACKQRGVRARCQCAPFKQSHSVAAAAQTWHGPVTHSMATRRSASRVCFQAYIAEFLRQREEAKAAALAAARAEDQKIQQYWSMVSRAHCSSGMAHAWSAHKGTSSTVSLVSG